MESASVLHNKGFLDFSLLVDGLKEEREQSMTIDVAYTYFSRKGMRFILADCPGHEIFFANVVTGLSKADTALMVLDISRGFRPLCRRHLATALLLQVPRIVIAINKMDLVHYRAEPFHQLADEVTQFIAQFPVRSEVEFVPVSARQGDGLWSPAKTMPWYEGPPLCFFLDNPLSGVSTHGKSAQPSPLRLPILYGDSVGGAGQVESGEIGVGKTYRLLPEDKDVCVEALWSGREHFQSLQSHRTVSLRGVESPALRRGQWIVDRDHQPFKSKHLSATLFWFSPEALCSSSRCYRLLLAGQNVIVRFTSLQRVDDGMETALLFSCEIEVADDAIFFDAYHSCGSTGAFILIDLESCATVGSGLITGS